MQHPSTYASQRTGSQRAPRTISPINAAQRAGYMLDAAPANKPAQPAAQPAGGQAKASTATQAH